MGFYVLSDKQGGYIRHDVGTGKYVPIRSFNHALKFADKDKANNILRSSLAKPLRGRFFLEYHETEEMVERDSVEKQTEICFRTIDEGEIDSWRCKVQQLEALFGGANDRYNELSNKLSDIDKEITDVEHYIEFGKFNCYQGWLCFKMMKNLLQQRRRYKNEMQVLDTIRRCKVDPDSIKSLSSNLNDIQNKLYTPRKFPELFKGVSR